MKKLFTLTALAAATALSFQSAAEIRINGFANLVGGVTSSDDTLFGYDEDINFRNGSLMAIQIAGDVNEKTSATAQLVARGSNDFEADFEWAYVSYEVSDTTSVSAGRIRMPLFRYSSSLDVGYSYHWVSAPDSVYGVAFNNLDGVRLDYSNYAGDWEYNIQAGFGSFDTKTTGSPTEGDNVALLTAEAANEWFKVRGVFGRADLTLDLTQSDSQDVSLAFNTLEAIRGQAAPLGIPALNELANVLDIQDDSATFVGFGIDIDKYTWFASAEVTQISVEDSFAEDDTAVYLTAGIRKGKWTPSITYEKFESAITAAELEHLPLINGISTSLTGTASQADNGAALAEAGAAQAQAAGLTDQARALRTQAATLRGQATSLRTLAGGVTGVGLGTQLSQDDEYSVWTLGVRYDLDTNLALKADISKRIDKADVNVGNEATLVRFAVNYVF